jgi:hypothetical protein
MVCKLTDTMSFFLLERKIKTENQNPKPKTKTLVEKLVGSWSEHTITHLHELLHGHPTLLRLCWLKWSLRRLHDKLSQVN